MKRKLQLLVLALLAGTAFGAKDNITVEETPCGQCTDYPTVADWVAAAMGPFQWETVPNLSVSTGASGSRNDRALVLSASGAPTIALACTPTLAGGFTLGANGPTWSGTTAYSGVCRYTATLGILAARSNKFRIEAIAPPSNDTTPPTTPTGLTATAGAGQVVLEWDAASDPYVGEAGSGIGSYRVRVNGATLITGIGASAGLSKQLSTYNIGAGSGTHTCTQNGASWTVVGAGTGIDGAADGFAGCLTQVVGPVCASTTVTALDAPATYNKAFLEIQSSSDANAIAYSYTVVRVGTSYSVQVRVRPTVGGNRTTLVNESIASLPVTLKTCKDASSTLTFYRSSDGNAFTEPHSTASGMGDTALIGLGATATSAGVAATAQFSNFSITNAPRVTYTHLNTSGAPTTYEVSAIDVAGNVGAYSPTSTATPSAPVDTTPPTRTVQPSGSANGSSSSINWDLGTCTDNVAVSGYSASLFAGAACAGSAIATIAQQASSAASSTGLTANTAYSLRSQCYDTAGNQAIAQSNCATATTAAGSNNPTAAPATVTVTPTGTAAPTTTLRVSWSAVQYADHYRVRYKKASASSYTLLPTNYTALTLDLTGLDVDTQYDVQISANNASESVSFGFEVGAVVYHGTTGSLSTSAIKFNPGHYLYTDKLLLNRSDLSSRTSTVISQINSQVCPYAEVTGMQVHITWAVLEPTQGGYSSGFTVVDQLYNALANCGKRLMLVVHERSWGSLSPNETIPPYIQTITYGAVQSAGTCVSGTASGYRKGGVIVANGTACSFNSGLTIYPVLWETTVMDRMIALSQAYGARYNSSSYPYFEMFSPVEELAGSPETSNGSFGFTTGALITQLQRLYTATRAAWPNTALRMKANYGPSISQQCAFFRDYLVPLDISIGGPDVHPGQEIWANRVFSNRLNECQDFRGVVPWVSEIQNPELGGKAGTYNASQLYIYSMDGGGAAGSGASNSGLNSLPLWSQYWVWSYNEWQGGTEQRWTTGLRPYITDTIDGAVGNGRDATRRSQSSVKANYCPTGYIGGCQ